VQLKELGIQLSLDLAQNELQALQRPSWQGLNRGKENELVKKLLIVCN
jgi:hypothetical protein